MSVLSSHGVEGVVDKSWVSMPFISRICQLVRDDFRVIQPSIGVA